MVLTRYVSETFESPLQEGGTAPSRVDLEFHGVDHSGSSFEARVFVDNAEADESTPRDVNSGYAGSFYVFGHGRCFGDVGHCDVPEEPRGPYDRRPLHKLTPQKHVIVLPTQILERAARNRVDGMKVTVVPVASDSPVVAEDNLFSFELLTVLTYEG